MRIRKNKILFFVLGISMMFVASGCGGQSQTVRDPFPEASVDARDQVANQRLAKTDGVVLVYARGLCCPSCALGVRKTMSRLSFVDSDKPSRGVLLDPQYQLVELAIKPDQVADSKSIWQAVKDAGYDPETIYRKDSTEVVKEEYGQRK